MRLEDRQRLIQRTIAAGQVLHPGDLLFVGFAQRVRCVRRSSPVMASLEEGFEGSEVQTFHVLVADLPPGLVIQAKKTTFICDSRPWRVVSSIPQVGEPQLQITANTPSAK